MGTHPLLAQHSLTAVGLWNAERITDGGPRPPPSTTRHLPVLQGLLCPPRRVGVRTTEPTNKNAPPPQSPRGRDLSINISFLLAFLFRCPSADKSILPFLFLLCFPALGPAWTQSCLSYPPPLPLPHKTPTSPPPPGPQSPNSPAHPPATLLNHLLSFSAPQPSLSSPAPSSTPHHTLPQAYSYL